jgi:hypothetical protein
MKYCPCSCADCSGCSGYDAGELEDQAPEAEAPRADSAELHAVGLFPGPGYLAAFMRKAGKP